MTMDLSFLPKDAALLDYIEAMQPQQQQQPFVSYFDFLPNKSVVVKTFSRGEFWVLAMRAIALIRRAAATSGNSSVKGLRMIHYVSGNIVEDLAIRCASVFLGSIPVTINWQADVEEQIHYKITATDSAIIFVDSRTPGVDKLRELYPTKVVIDVEEIHTTAPITAEDLDTYLREAAASQSVPLLDDVRCVIFTSGTTGQPKGVELSYSNYRTNRGTFESFLGFEDPATTFVPIVVNPMHHTNSTSITDW